MSTFDLARWERECSEWQAIAFELSERPEGCSAYQVTLEQRKRMLARGERPMEFPDDWDSGRKS